MLKSSSNRLIHEKSPYLLQHASNPVDWYPWGTEAFERAQKEDKPVLVSIGYSTCHWCHVMERESYEDPAVAQLMNKYLVNIKVDREERPDVDKIYMTAVSAMTGQGGWPLNMFLTPDLKPIYGGTYFPPEAKWGHPAWKDVVTQIGESWKSPDDRRKMLEAATHIAESLKKYSEVSPEPVEGEAAWLDQGFSSLKATYDSQRGGFGPAPKFPMPVYHNFLLRYYARTKNKEALEMSLHTLREMAKGGIYDHLGGGFARYSTDENWHVPHFEKMLYDNAQLAVNYLEAFQITRDPEFKRVSEETLAYIQREMTHPLGGFYSAEDADSFPTVDAKEKTEGAFYVWEKKEILEILGKEAGEVFCLHYGVQDGGNAGQDPHGEFIGKNILFVAEESSFRRKPESSPSTEDWTPASAGVTQSKKKLFEARAKRPRPHLDDKIISAWNGLMISAFAKAYQILDDQKYLNSAQKAAQFVNSNLYDKESGVLYRRWREGDRKEWGIVDDYQFVAQGLIDLYEADFDHTWLDWAVKLMEESKVRFYDSAQGGYFMTSVDQDKNLLLRIKEDSDNVEPSASSIAALNLLRLSQILDRKDLEAIATKTMQSFGAHMKESPRALPQMLAALDFALTEPRQIVIAGKKAEPDTAAMLNVLHKYFIPVKTVILADEKNPMKPLDGKSTAFVCFHHVCKEPTNDLQSFEKELQGL